MARRTLAVCTAMYPAAIRYLSDWYHSVCRQTDRDFDLWIGLDALGIDEACRAMGGVPDARWVVGAPATTPAALRQQIIEAVVGRYRQVIFVDADDMLSPTRVEAARAALTEYDVVGCALRLGNAAGADIGVTFGPDGETDLKALLPRCNVFGLSNSAYRARTLDRCLPVPAGCQLVDWLLASRASATGASMWFDPVPRMFYRQHAKTTAPVLGPFTAARVLEAAGQVQRHFDLLLDSGWIWPPGTRSPFVAQRARVQTFVETMRRSAGAVDRYVSALNRLEPRHVWWWAVAHPELEELWDRSF
jgi:hypothetical protein